MLLAVSAVLALAGCGRWTGPDRSGDRPSELVVSAAVSLGDVLRELQPAFEQRHPGVRLRFNLGSSGALRAQIEQGAPVDVFIAADAASMDALVRAGRVKAGAVRSVATNRIVLVRPAGRSGVSGWEDLRGAEVRRVGLGNPQHVPAGQYGRAALEHLGLWPAVRDKLVYGEDARQVLTYVERGEVEAGIVYETDGARSERVRVVAAAPVGSHPPIVYPGAVLREARLPEQADAFLRFLLGPEGRAALARRGFGAGG